MHSCPSRGMLARQNSATSQTLPLQFVGDRLSGIQRTGQARYAQLSSEPEGLQPMPKRSKDKPASPLKREMERLTPAPPGRKRPKLGPDRSPQRDPRNIPAKE